MFFNNLKYVRLAVFTAFLFCVSTLSWGQTANQYCFSTGTSNLPRGFAGESDVSWTTITTSAADDVAYGPFSIGFNFVYEGTTYSQFSVNSNGLMRLGGTVVTNAWTNNITAASNQPKLMPLWDDISTGNNGRIRYYLDGTAPNRTLVVDFRMRHNNSTTSGNPRTMRFQVRLLETTNEIYFFYLGVENNTDGANIALASASYGIGGANANNFISINTTDHSASNVTAKNDNTLYPTSTAEGRRWYRFAPPSATQNTVPTFAFGSGSWNVFAYQSRAQQGYDPEEYLDLSATRLEYRGWYNHGTAVSINSSTAWGGGGSPSDASGYQGACVHYDNHVVVYKRQGFPCGNYTFSAPHHDDAIRIYIDGVEIYETHTCCASPSIPGTYYLGTHTTVEVRVAENLGGSSLQLNITGATPPVGDPNVFGDNTWNVYGFDDNGVYNSSLVLSGDYHGYYTQNYDASNNFGFNSRDMANAGWDINGRPSNSSTWQGCLLPSDERFTFVHKRRGFPCGTYELTLREWDDATRVYVNGVDVWSCTSWHGDGGVCSGQTGNNAPAPINIFELDANSTIEVRTAENGGGAQAWLDIIPVVSGNLAGNGQQKACPVRGNQWVHFYTHPDGHYLASVRGTTPSSNLGDVTVTAYVDGTVQLVPACDMPSYETAVMQRHWVISPNDMTYDAPAFVRLPYTGIEHQNLATASGTSSSPDDLVSYNTITPPYGQETVFLSKYSGPNNVNANPNDNCPALGGNGNTIRYSNSGTGVNNPVPGVTARYSDFSIPGFSEFWLHGNTIVTPLSVQLSDFSASCETRTITWTTLSEQNSSHFVVEQSRDGYNWEVIATVAGAGTTNSVNTYTVNNNLVADYYRLKQVNFDGKFDYYGSIHVDCGSLNNGLTVYPNPNSGTFMVAINSSEELGESTIFIHDVSGKVVAMRDVNVLSGTNTVHFENNNLMPGTYIVSVQGKDKNTLVPVRLVIQ